MTNELGGRDQEVNGTKRAMTLSGNMYVADVKRRVKPGRTKRRVASSVLCDRRITMTPKAKFYKSLAGPNCIVWFEVSGG